MRSVHLLFLLAVLLQFFLFLFLSWTVQAKLYYVELSKGGGCSGPKLSICTLNGEDICTREELSAGVGRQGVNSQRMRGASVQGCDLAHVSEPKQDEEGVWVFVGRAVTVYFKAMGAIFLTARKESFRYEQGNTGLRHVVLDWNWKYW